MKPLEEIYKGSFFGKRDRLNWRAPLVCGAAMITFELNGASSVIDVGCATGEYVARFNSLGVFAEGIEGSKNAIQFLQTENVYIADLRFKVNIGRVYTLCMSLEVAEHIEEEYSDQYVDNLIKLSKSILITAAPPGQGGHHHVNCRPKDYWVEKFACHDYGRNNKKEEQFKRLLAPFKHRKEINVYRKNVLVFELGE